MPKYLLLKHYRGGPEPHRPVPPMDQWAPEDVEAHMAFLKHVRELFEENGELWGIHLTGLPRVPRLVNDGAQRRDVSVA